MVSLSNEEKEYIIYNLKGFFGHFKLEKRINKVEKDINRLLQMKKETESFLDFIKDVEKNIIKKHLQVTKSQDNILRKPNETIKEKEKEKIITNQRPVTPELNIKKKVNKTKNQTLNKVLNLKTHIQHNNEDNKLLKSADFSKIKSKKTNENKNEIKTENKIENKIENKSESKNEIKTENKNEIKTEIKTENKNEIKNEKTIDKNENKIEKKHEIKTEKKAINKSDENKKNIHKKLRNDKSVDNIRLPKKKVKMEKENEKEREKEKEEIIMKHTPTKSKLIERPKTPENAILKRRRNKTNVNLANKVKKINQIKEENSLSFKENLINEIKKKESIEKENEKIFNLSPKGKEIIEEKKSTETIVFDGSFGNKNNGSPKPFNNGSFGSNYSQMRNSEKKVSSFQSEENKNNNSQNKEISNFSNKKISALYNLLNSGFFDIQSKIKFTYINKELYNNFDKNELKKQLLSYYEDEYKKFTLIINKYDLKPFVPETIMQNSLNFLTKDEENKLLLNEQKIEIINVFKFLLLILGEDISKIEDKNIINYTFKDIYSKYKVTNIKDLVLKIALEKLQRLKIEQIESIKNLINNKEDILSPAMLLRLNRSVSFMTFILRDFYNYLFLQTEDGTKLYEIRAGIQDYDSLGNKIKRLKSLM